MTSTTTYDVTGMTCAHCVQAVTDEVSAIPGVRDVDIELVAGGTSTVTVVSEAPLAARRRARRGRRGGLRAGRYVVRPAATLTAFAAGLTAVFAVALGLGSAVGPVVGRASPPTRRTPPTTRTPTPTPTHAEDAAHDGRRRDTARARGRRRRLAAAPRQRHA